MNRLTIYPDKIKTYDIPWLILAFFVSLLWFRVNGQSIFPVGLLGGLAITYMVHSIDRALGKKSYAGVSVVLCLVATAIGLTILNQ